jgi:hypothetical protein
MCFFSTHDNYGNNGNSVALLNKGINHLLTDAFGGLYGDTHAGQLHSVSLRVFSFGYLHFSVFF